MGLRGAIDRDTINWWLHEAEEAVDKVMDRALDAMEGPHDHWGEEDN